MQTTHLSVERAGRPVLRDLNFTLNSGEIWCITGPNGSGKTTLLHAILGLLPHRGSLKLQCPRSKIGFVPQQLYFSPFLPALVREFLELSCLPSGRTKAEQEKALQWSLLHTGTGHLLDKSIHELSGGERQRILLARALVNLPELLVLDEPTNEIDASAQKKFLDTLLHLRRSHKTSMLIVTHDRRICYELGAREAVMQSGVLALPDASPGKPEASK